MMPRTAGTAGVVSVLLLIPISVLLAGTDYPFADATASEVAEYFGEHRTAFMAVVVIDLLSTALFATFVAGLSSTLESGWSSLVLVAGSMTAFAIGLEDVTFAAAGFEASPEVVEPLWRLGHFGFGMLVHVFIALFLAAGAMAVLNSKQRWPRWLPAVGILGAAGSAAVPFALLGHDVDFAAGNIEHLVGTLPWAVWVLLAAIILIRAEAMPDRSGAVQGDATERRSGSGV